MARRAAGVNVHHALATTRATTVPTCEENCTVCTSVAAQRAAQDAMVTHPHQKVQQRAIWLMAAVIWT